LARENALRLALNLPIPMESGLSRAHFALGKQTVLLEDVVEIKTDKLAFHFRASSRT